MVIKQKLKGGVAEVRRPQAPKPGGSGANNYSAPPTRPQLPTRPAKPAQTAPAQTVAERHGRDVAEKRPPPVAEPVPMLLSLYDLRVHFGIRFSRVHLWRLCRDGRFPRPVRIGERGYAWRRADIERWAAGLDEVDWATAGGA